MRTAWWILVGMSCLGAGCAKRDLDDLFAPEAGTIVVDAFLVVGQTFPEIVLSQTLAANVPYTAAQAALEGAVVIVSGGQTSVLYQEIPEKPGLYAPRGLRPRVEPEVVYTLDITAADGRRVRASTLTPRPFPVAEWVLLDDAGATVQRSLARFEDYGDSLFAQPENQLVYSQGLLEARFAASGIVGIQVGLFSRTPNSPVLIDLDRIDEEDLVRVNSSPPFVADEGTLRLPWFAIFFEGKYVFKVWSMDRNWFDLARTDPVLRGGGFGFGGQAGDDFERPIFHLEGGIGLFGSGAADSVGVVVHPRP